MLKKIKQIKNSLFSKLLIIALIMGLLINITAIIHFWTFANRETRHIAHKNMRNYLEFIIKDLGEPPNQTKAKEIAEEYKLKIRYKSSSFEWSTHEDMPSPKDIKENAHYKGRSFGHYNKHMYYSIEKENGSFLFMLDFEKPPPHEKRWMMSLIVVLSFILLTGYFLVKKVLMPVTWLSQGVKKISKGDFYVQIPENRKDELGALIRSFNEMAKEIKRMITLRERLLTDVSHEMRTPLTRLKLSLEMMKPNSRQKSLREDVRELEMMLTEILETERLNSKYYMNKIRIFDLELLLRNISKYIKDIYPKVKYEFINKGVKKIKGNEELLKRAFSNILENAFKYASQNINSKVIVNLENKTDSIQLSISDNGPGISKKEIINIFEPFYRTDKSRARETGGYGLGLSIVKKILDLHNANISVKSSIKKGSVVVVNLPQTKGESRL
ncbi:MAG: HAMP domain-containing histidine kinase [Spirochaetia bacterium]|nr:HAMP domain-containing histidine kinase [Spirochaetia bacterium]